MLLAPAPIKFYNKLKANTMDAQNSGHFAGGKLTVFLSAALLFSTLLIAGSTFDAYRFLQVLREESSRNYELSNLRGVIIHLDEVLTMSARMAAATGNLKWEERYRKHEPTLDDAIKTAIRLVPGEFMQQAVAMTDNANLKLVAMENASFEQVRQGNKDEAQRILFSQAYENQKEIYASGIEKVALYLEQTANAGLRELRNKIRIYVNTAILVITVLLVLWIAVFVFIKRNEKAMLVKNAELEHYSGELEELERKFDVGSRNKSRRQIR